MAKNNDNPKSIIKEFLLKSDATENEINILNNVYPKCFNYCKEIIKLYLSNNEDNKIKIIKKRMRNINFIIKKYINNNIFNSNKYVLNSNIKDSQDIIYILLIIFCFNIFKFEVALKNDKSSENDLLFLKLYELLSIILQIISKMYTDHLINDKKLEIILKLLIILSISTSIIEVPNKNDKIENMMFFSKSINILKQIYKKIFSYQKSFTKEQEEVTNNIILFIRENIIDYSEQKPIINKSYLSHNDFCTSYIIELIFSISKMKNPEIINNFIDLLTNIYTFSFRYDNIMNPLLKILEPLFINIKLKQFEDIKYELNICNFPIKLLNALIKKEEDIINEDPNFLRTGFYLGNKICGISSELDNLEDDFAIIFGFSLHEINIHKNNIKEWTLINIKNIENEKEKDHQIKIWLSQKENLNGQYILKVTIKDKIYDTKIVITSKKTYIFSFQFTKGSLFKPNKLKIFYTCDLKSEQTNLSEIKELEEINIESFKSGKKNIYIGCDINNYNPIVLTNMPQNTFTGFMGTVIILDLKKLSKKGPEEILKYILELKGDYASIFPILLENNEYKTFFYDNTKKYNNKEEYTSQYNEIKKLNSPESKFVESIKALISPKSFCLVEYRDEIDYLNQKNNYDLYLEHKKQFLFVRQNYLNFTQKKNYSLNNDKMIVIFTSYFNNRFHIFENEDSLKQFTKYNGIHYLCLLLEYHFQIISQIFKLNEEKRENIDDSISSEIENNISEITKLFCDYMFNIQYFRNFKKEFNHFLYQFAVVLKNYLTINNIGKTIFEVVKALLKKINELIEIESESKDEIIKIRSKLLDLLQNISLFFCQINDNALYLNVDCYLDIMEENLKNLTDSYSFNFLEKLLSFSFIFNDKNSLIKNKNNLENLQEKYSNLLTSFLKYSNKKLINKKEIEENNQRKSSHKNSFSLKKKKIDEESQNDNINDNLNNYLEYALLSIKNPSIFSGLLKVLYKSDLIGITSDRFIKQIKGLLEKNYKHMDKTNHLISENCLIILSAYYLIHKEKEKKLHDFLKNLNFHMGFFICIITSLKQIKYITDDNKSSNKSNEESDSTPISETTDSLLPLKELNLKKLNPNQNRALIFLLQDCISMLFIKNTLNIYENINENDSQKIYDTLMNNFNVVLDYPGKKVYKDIFSSNSRITPELFYFKWKKSNNEKKKELIQEIKNLHEKLLKTHTFPFIFRFLILINENILEESNIINDYTIDLVEFIFKQLEKELKDFEPKKKENDSRYILNIINLIILINILIIQKKKQYFNNEKFVIIFYKIIDIFEKTGLLYSNYCFEIEEKNGKTISEFCFDLFIYFLDSHYDKGKENKFKDVFIKENKKEKVFLTIFYIIDLFKEEKLDKDKKTKSLIEVFIESKNLNYIHNNIFVVKNNNVKVFGNSINKIKGINFTLYFLAKSFLYLKSGINKDLSTFLYKKILPEISKNLFDFWCKRESFYGHKLCKKFLLYYETKSFFEQHVIQHGGGLKLYDEFFDRDLPTKLKGQFTLTFCFSSRLLDLKEDEIINNIKEEDEEEGDNKEDKNLYVQDNNKNLNEIIFNFNINKQFFLFENSEKKNILYNPKNVLMKSIFSSTYKEILFEDKIFEKIRATYCCTFNRNKTFNITTKQLNYPARQKNFSNSLEPKIFIRRDFNFYRPEFFNVSHGYIKSNLIKEKDKSDLFFYPHIYYDINQNKNSVFSCEMITNQFIYFGKIYIGEYFISFESTSDPRDSSSVNMNIYFEYAFSQRDNDNKTKKDKHFLIFIKDIKEIMRRRTLLMNQSIEIFLKNGKSFFFNFFKTDHCEKVFKILNNINDNLLTNGKKAILEKDIKLKIKETLALFKKGEITNYQYILRLNKLSSRTYNDLTQYPIFPWILLKMNKLEEITKSPEKFLQKETKDKDCSGKNENYTRDMNYPVSMQNPEKREEEILKFLDDSDSKFCYHCGTHYSTSSYIFYYLMRINPFGQNLIKLQNYKQENPNRMFLSFRETQLILQTSTDNRELIPDLYCYIDYLCNLNCSFNGIRNNLNLVDDFYIFDEYKVYNENANLISSFVEYLSRHKQLINTIEMTKNLDKWVDIIFGKKQLPQKKEEAANSCNIFSKYCYESRINLENKLKKYRAQKDKGLLTEKSLKSKLQNKINIINNFGICPIQILKFSLLKIKN